MADAAVHTPIGVVRFALRQHEQIKSSFAGTLAAAMMDRARDTIIGKG